MKHIVLKREILSNSILGQHRKVLPGRFTSSLPYFPAQSSPGDMIPYS
jgi:hypothetical protein